MRKAELLQLFGHTDYVWTKFRRFVPDSELSRIADGSGWPTLRHCLWHIVAAYDRWVPAIVDLKNGSMPEIGAEDFMTWEQIEADRSRVRRALGERLKAWSDEELAVIQDVKIDGEALLYSRGELIAHLLLHERGHHGDVTTLLWQLGMEPDIQLDYRFFLGRHEEEDPKTPDVVDAGSAPARLRARAGPARTVFALRPLRSASLVGSPSRGRLELACEPARCPSPPG